MQHVATSADNTNTRIKYKASVDWKEKIISENNTIVFHYIILDTLKKCINKFILDLNIFQIKNIFGCKWLEHPELPLIGRL
jgi:hypothetical protein